MYSWTKEYIQVCMITAVFLRGNLSSFDTLLAKVILTSTYRSYRSIKDPFLKNIFIFYCSIAGSAFISIFKNGSCYQLSFIAQNTVHLTIYSKKSCFSNSQKFPQRTYFDWALWIFSVYISYLILSHCSGQKLIFWIYINPG